MVKNVKLKKIFKCTVSPMLSFINRIVPKNKNIILLYSANKGIQHSLLPMKQYLVNNKFNDDYRIYCGIENMKYAGNDHEVEYIDHKRSFFVYLFAKYVFYTTGQIPIKPSKKQFVIHLRHGNTNFKTSGKLTKINNGDEFYFTHMIASSDYYVPIMMQEYGCQRQNIVVAGDAILDGLFDVEKNYDLGDFNKVLLWLPTFRQSDYLGYDNSSIEDLVPMFKESDYELLNDKLKEYDIRLIIKMHPAQRIDKSYSRHFSNLNIYSNSEFEDAGYELYSLMAQVDGLIGDYSSASIQYLLMDNPQAYVIPDIVEYTEKRGFVFSDPEKYMAGHIIKNQTQFFDYIKDIAQNKDLYSEKRKKVRDVLFKYQDNHNCERIANFCELKKTERKYGL